MAKKKLITLAKELEFNTAEEYLWYIYDSYRNGQIKQVKSLYNQMKPEDKKEFRQWAGYNTGCSYAKILSIVLD